MKMANISFLYAKHVVSIRIFICYTFVIRSVKMRLYFHVNVRISNNWRKYDQAMKVVVLFKASNRTSLNQVYYTNFK